MLASRWEYWPVGRYCERDEVYGFQSLIWQDLITRWPVRDHRKLHRKLFGRSAVLRGDDGRLYRRYIVESGKGLAYLPKPGCFAHVEVHCDLTAREAAELYARYAKAVTR